MTDTTAGRLSYWLDLGRVLESTTSLILMKEHGQVACAMSTAHNLGLKRIEPLSTSPNLRCDLTVVKAKAECSTSGPARTQYSILDSQVGRTIPIDILRADDQHES